MSTRPTEPNHNIILATLRDYVEQIVEEGLDGLPISPASLQREPSPRPAATPRESEDASTRPPTAARSETSEAQAAPSAAGTAAALFAVYPGLEKTANLAELRAFIGDCQRCKLAKSRTHLVFGVGNPKARLMFVGEGPGADEDAQGEPFVGRAGQLLTDIIERGMGISRADVYICNVVKCRPPENRKPEPSEIAACQPFLWHQIELVRPQVIVALGSVAAQALLAVKTPISRMRGVWHQARGTMVMPTFHPAYLLRNPADKRLVWSDVQEVMKVLGLPAAKRGRPR
jgi:uracil-DNA glycosylase family 4